MRRAARTLRPVRSARVRRTVVVLSGLVLALLVAAASPAAAGTSAGASALPTTGRAIPILAAGVAIGVALLLRAGASRLGGDDDDPEK